MSQGSDAARICLRPDALDPLSVIMMLFTDYVDGWHKRLVKAGVTCEKAPNHNERCDIYQVFYRDPDGYRVEIQRYSDPAWPAV